MKYEYSQTYLQVIHLSTQIYYNKWLICYKSQNLIDKKTKKETPQK